MRTINLTYYADGSWTTKQSFSFAAGEALRLRFTPSASTDMTGKTLRLVFSDTPADAPLINSTTFSFVSAAAGTFDFTNADATTTLDTATFEFPTDAMNVEIWNATDGILMRRYVGNCTANPRASGEAPSYPDPPIDWSDVENTPTTLAGYGITDAVASASLAAVATSGAYGDLSGKPTLGTAAAADTTDFDAAGAAAAVAGSLAAVAISGAYGDLSGTPSATAFNGVTITGSSTPTLAVTGTTAVSGTNTGDQSLAAYVVGPSSATATAIAVFDGTTGKLVKNSAVTIDSNGSVSGPSAVWDINFGGGATFTSLSSPGASTYLKDGADPSKVASFDCSGISTTTNRVYAFPNASGTFALGTGTANYITYWTGTNTVAGSVNFQWDATNFRLGIGITPTNFLHAVGIQPASVGTATGTSSGTSGGVTITAATGGNTTIATTGTGGSGGQVNIRTGTGGQATAAATSSTGGSSGNFNGGSGVGQAATGLATGTARGGASGSLNYSSGVGGAASSGTTANIGGAAGAAYVFVDSGGAATATSSATATGGNQGNCRFGAQGSGSAKGGGAATSVDGNAIGGSGTTLQVLSGFGGSATASGNGDATGGDAGSISITGANGGNGSSSGGSSAGGVGADITIQPGLGGSGDTPGANGSIKLRTPAGTLALSVGIGENSNETVIAYVPVTLSAIPTANRPGTPTAGMIYFDFDDSHFYGWNGSTWKQLDN